MATDGCGAKFLCCASRSHGQRFPRKVTLTAQATFLPAAAREAAWKVAKYETMPADGSFRFALYALAVCAGHCAPLILRGLGPIGKSRESDTVFYWIHALGILPRCATLFPRSVSSRPSGPLCVPQWCGLLGEILCADVPRREVLVAVFRRTVGLGSSFSSGRVGNWSHAVCSDSSTQAECPNHPHYRAFGVYSSLRHLDFSRYAHESSTAILIEQRCTH